MVQQRSGTLSQFPEGEILAEIQRVLGSYAQMNSDSGLGIGDDAALLPVPSATAVISVDTLSENRDFRSGWWSDPQQAGQDIGLKATAQNLSDINAMGAEPTALLISLTLPEATSLDWVRGFYQGVVSALDSLPEHCDCKVVGGDLGGGSEIVVSLIALGELRAGSELRRSGAQPGDTVALSGTLGRAAAGLALLERGYQPRSQHRSAAAPVRQRQLSPDDLIAAQLRPQPPLAAGPAAVNALATAGMDISDGLVKDTQRVAEASGVSIQLQAELLEPLMIPLLAAGEHISRSTAWKWVLHGGEDYALLACFPPEAELPTGFQRIGRVLPQRPAEMRVSIAGDIDDVELNGGWESYGNSGPEGCTL